MAAAIAVLGAGGFLTFAIVTANAEAPIADRPAPDATALSIDGTPVPFRELDLYLDRDRSAVVAEYQSRGVDISSAGFWQTPVDGLTPARRLVEKAQDDVVRLHTQLRSAADAQVEAPQTYDQLVRAWQNENARRANALDQGQPVYGPQQFSESDFLDYLLGSLSQQAQTELAAQGTIYGSDAAARDEQYQRLIDERVARAKVTPTTLLGTLPRYACVAAGSC